MAIKLISCCILFAVINVSLCGLLPKKIIPRTCLDYARNDVTANGYYPIADGNGNGYTVYCDFTSEPGSVWTLVMSWSLKYNKLHAFSKKSLTLDAPVNMNSPNWNAYRLSHNRMQSLKAHSSHWRTTCSFPVYKVDYTDYVRAKFIDFDIITFTGYGVCKNVEFVDIRGNAGAETDARFWQSITTSDPHMLHIDSSTVGHGCSFIASAGAVHGEDNFGFYHVKNKNFRCTSNPLATTQYWFGGYV